MDICRIATPVRVALVILLTISNIVVFAQSIDTSRFVEYGEKMEYEIGDIQVVGNHFSESDALVSVSGLKKGANITLPGKDLTNAIKTLMGLKLFKSVEIALDQIIGDVVFLEIRVEEAPRYHSTALTGIKKSEQDDIHSIINKYILPGAILSDHLKSITIREIEKHYQEKGFLDASVIMTVQMHPKKPGNVMLNIDVNKGDKIKIQQIEFLGNEVVSDKKLLKLLNHTKSKGKLFGKSRFDENLFKEDQLAISNYYHSLGYRDAKVVDFRITRNTEKDLVVLLEIEEGRPYYFGNISWRGNTKYSDELLDELLGISKGDKYNAALLEQRLRFSEEGKDISSLYLDNGHLFFDVRAIEKSIQKDTIDLEIRIMEGGLATIDKIIIKGNDRTHENVIRREIRTVPDQPFSREAIIRSQRALVNMGYFSPENLGINTPVNPERGTVDIEYELEEISSDQLELSAGWGGSGNGVVGTLGFTFNNFSLRNILNRSSWDPIPQGDAQRLSFRVQSTGRAFQSYNFSFNEPWLGGKKPNSLNMAGFFTNYRSTSTSESEDGRFQILGGSLSLGRRINFPDDYTVATTALNVQRYFLDNWSSGLFRTDDGTIVSNGTYYNINFSQTFARNTLNHPIFPTEGSSLSLNIQFTPPYSLFTSNSNEDAPQDRFQFLEYHKWKFSGAWYTKVVGKLVLKAQAKFGFLGSYNRNLGTSPFERFQLGGDGLNNQQVGFTGTDIIALRGYETNDLENNLINGALVATPIYDKFTVELRYPLSLNPSATIYGLLFAEGGNAWQSFRDFNPFDLKRSVGAGLRVNLPMFGTLGFDYGIGFDKPGERSLKGLGKFSIILGFEPE